MAETTICAGCGATVATGDEFCPRCDHARVAARELRRKATLDRQKYILYALFLAIMLAGYLYLR